MRPLALIGWVLCVATGAQVVPAEWIDTSCQPRTRSLLETHVLPPTGD